MEIKSVYRNINVNNNYNNHHNISDLNNILIKINNEDTSFSNKSVQPGETVTIDGDYLSSIYKSPTFPDRIPNSVNFTDVKVRINRVTRLDPDTLFDYPRQFKEAQTRWNRHALLTQGIIKPHDDQTTINEKLEPYESGDYDSILATLSRVQLAYGSFVVRETGEPNMRIAARVTPGFPSTIFINTNVRESTPTIYHELTHVLQQNGIVEFVPKPREDRDYFIADEFAEGKLFFHELGPEQQAEVVSAYAAGVRWSKLIG